jgi:hypothetical protein
MHGRTSIKEGGESNAEVRIQDAGRKAEVRNQNAKIQNAEQVLFFILTSYFCIFASNTFAFASDQDAGKRVRDLASFGESGVRTVPAGMIG